MAIGLLWPGCGVSLRARCVFWCGSVGSVKRVRPGPWASSDSRESLGVWPSGSLTLWYDPWWPNLLSRSNLSLSIYVCSDSLTLLCVAPAYPPQKKTSSTVVNQTASRRDFNQALKVLAQPESIHTPSGAQTLLTPPTRPEPFDPDHRGEYTDQLDNAFSSDRHSRVWSWWGNHELIESDWRLGFIPSCRSHTHTSSWNNPWHPERLCGDPSVLG